MAGHKVKADELLKFVKSVNWETAARTFGNSHNTLIGLLVDAWIRFAPKRKAHYVLEAPPSLEENEKRKEKARRLSDVILVHDVRPVGIVEVEGLDPFKACKKMARYLKMRKPTRFLFGLCVFYACRPRGGKGQKKELYWLKVKDAKDKDTGLGNIKKKAQGISTDKPLMLIFVDKEYESDPLDPNIHLRKAGAQYGRGKVNHVFGYIIVRGKSGSEICLLDKRNKA